MKRITESTLLARVNKLRETIAMYEAVSDPAVLKIQQDLIAKGYPLKPDGIMGPKTKAAMDWQAKSNVRDAGLQATKNMDPTQPAPAVPTDPAKKAAYDAAIKNMDPNQPAQPVAQPQTPAAPPAQTAPPAAPPAPKGNVQNQAVQDFTNKFLATQDKEAAQPAAPSTAPNAGIDFQKWRKDTYGPDSEEQSPVQQGNAAAPSTGPVTPITPDEFPDFGSMFDSEYSNDQLAKSHGMTGMRDPRYVAAVKAEYENSGSGRQYPGEPEALRTASGSSAGHHESIKYNPELARILEIAKW